MLLLTERIIVQGLQSNLVSLLNQANFTILSVWTILSPIARKEVIKVEDNFGRPAETFSFCDWRDSLPYYVSLGAVNSFLLIYALVLAWQTRHISTELSESSYIYRSMAFTLLTCFMGVPVTILSSGNPSAYFYVVTGIIFVMSESTLLLIFIPKISALRATATSSSEPQLPKIFQRTFRSRETPSNTTSLTSRQVSDRRQNAAEIQGEGGLTFSRTALEDKLRRLTAEVERLEKENKTLETENNLLKEKIQVETENEPLDGLDP